MRDSGGGSGGSKVFGRQNVGVDPLPSSLCTQI